MIDHCSVHLNRYWHRYAACPRCGVEAGDICIDQRFPHKIPWRRTLKPHVERPRADGKPRRRGLG